MDFNFYIAPCKNQRIQDKRRPWTKRLKRQQRNPTPDLPLSTLSMTLEEPGRQQRTLSIT
ncbi:MAG: hypothetical protein Q9171_005779 [Xanthocarpia ochracea]